MVGIGTATGGAIAVLYMYMHVPVWCSALPRHKMRRGRWWPADSCPGPSALSLAFLYGTVTFCARDQFEWGTSKGPPDGGKDPQQLVVAVTVPKKMQRPRPTT